MKSVSVVWFKRDLRLRDHAALHAAWKLGQPVLLVYCVEQEFLNHPDTAARHLRFVVQSLAQMRVELEPYGHTVYEFSGGIDDLLHYLLQQGYQPQLFSHQETGLWTTYQRDLPCMRNWCLLTGRRLGCCIPDFWRRTRPLFRKMETRGCSSRAAKPPAGPT